MIRLKAVFPKVDTRQMGCVSLTNTPRTCTEILWFCDLYPLEISSGARKILIAGRNLDQKTADIVQKTLTGVLPPREFALELKPRTYQSMGTELWLQRKALLIADEMGIGKTLQALAGFTQSETLPAAVIVKVGIIPQWVREAERCLPGIRVHTLKTRKVAPLPPADIYITSYTRLNAWAETLAKIVSSVVFDEIHELRHRDTGKYAGARHLTSTLAGKGGYRLGLSGSPIFNYGDEMYSAIDLLDEGVLGTFEEFSREWCENSTGHLKVRDTVAFGRLILDQGLMLRRTKKDVAIELPKRTRIVETIHVDEKMLMADDSMSIELAKRVLSSTDFHTTGEAARQFDLKLRQATGIAKAPYVAEFARMLLEQGTRLVIFAWHREVWTVLMEKLKIFNPVMFTGSESAKEKEASLEAFKSGESSVLLMNLRSCEGVDGLQYCCDTIINAELDWTDQVHEQCATRVDRPGQKNPTMEIFLVSDEGSDPTVARINGVKREQAEGILNPFGVVATVESDGRRIKTMAREFLERRGIKVENRTEREDELPLENVG
jgi:SNF2 family DNA or RNA helicase